MFFYLNIDPYLNINPLIASIVGAIVGGLVVYFIQKKDLKNKNKKRHNIALKTINYYLIRIVSKADSVLTESFIFRGQFSIIKDFFKSYESDFIFLKDFYEHWINDLNLKCKEKLKENKHIQIILKNQFEARRNPFAIFLHRKVMSFNITSDTISNLELLEINNEEVKQKYAFLTQGVLRIMQLSNSIDTLLKEINLLQSNIMKKKEVSKIEVVWLESLSNILQEDIVKMYCWLYLTLKLSKKIYKYHDFDLKEITLTNESDNWDHKKIQALRPFQTDKILAFALDRYCTMEDKKTKEDTHGKDKKAKKLNLFLQKIRNLR